MSSFWSLLACFCGCLFLTIGWLLFRLYILLFIKGSAETLGSLSNFWTLPCCTYCSSSSLVIASHLSLSRGRFVCRGFTLHIQADFFFFCRVDMSHAAIKHESPPKIVKPYWWWLISFWFWNHREAVWIVMLPYDDNVKDVNILIKWLWRSHSVFLCGFFSFHFFVEVLALTHILSF